MKKKGFLVTFEGGDGAGKTTQFNLLCAYLDEKRIPYIKAREPGGTAVSEAVRAILKNPDYADKSTLTELLLFEAARAEIVQKVIKPALAKGKVVVLDRFYDSTFAYQGCGRQMGTEVVGRLNEISTQGVSPDLTFYLRISPEMAFARKGGADKSDAIELAGLDFHKRVAQGFDMLAEQEKYRYVTIDATKSVEEISAEVNSVFGQRFKTPKVKQFGE